MTPFFYIKIDWTVLLQCYKFVINRSSFLKYSIYLFGIQNSTIVMHLENCPFGAPTMIKIYFYLTRYVHRIQSKIVMRSSDWQFQNCHARNPIMVKLES